MALLTRWQPTENIWEEMTRFQRDMEREMERIFGRWGVGARPWPALAAAYPLLNMWEDDNHLYAEAELPGIKLEDLEIYVTGEDQLTIKGTRPAAEMEKGTWHRQERGVGTFSRPLTLPIGVDPAKVEARLENGVLTIQMAKTAAAKPKYITVKAQ